MLRFKFYRELVYVLAACTILLSSCHSQNAPTLIEQLDSGQTIETRVKAARQLAEHNAIEAVPALIQSLKGPEMVRVSAARALGDLHDIRAVEPLIAGLSDDSPRAREAAAGALGKLGDPRAVNPLITALRKGSDESGPALARLGMPAVGPLIDCLREVEVRHAAVEALTHVGQPAIPALIEAFHSDDPAVRLAAAQVLAENDDSRSAEVLQTALRPGDDLRLAAVAHQFLIRCGGPDNEALLRNTLLAYGDFNMAKDFFDSGKPALKAAVEQWARRNNYPLDVLNKTLSAKR